MTQTRGCFAQVLPTLIQDACVHKRTAHKTGTIQTLLNKDASREVANRAAAQTGLSADVLKRIGAMLTPFLDQNRDGSLIDA